MNTLKLLGPGLLKKDKVKKEFLSEESKMLIAKKSVQRSRKTASVEKFLREILGTHLIQIEKKF